MYDSRWESIWATVMASRTKGTFCPGWMFITARCWGLWINRPIWAPLGGQTGFWPGWAFAIAMAINTVAVGPCGIAALYIVRGEQ
jgi:hypothetical protein